MESAQLTCSLADFDGSCMSECKAEKALQITKKAALPLNVEHDRVKLVLVFGQAR
jgi:hypothetical protein